MDDIKDIKKQDDFSKFVDAQEVRTDPFGKNRAAERLYRRTERICAALYLLTRHLSADEPIRQKVRSECVTLFPKVLDLKDEMRAAESNALFSFQSTIRHLISLVRVLSAGGYVSFPNADAVIAALDELGAFVSSSQRTILSEGLALTRDEIVGDTGPLQGQYSAKDIRDRRYIKDKIALKDSHELTVRSETNGTLAIRAQAILVILRGSNNLGIKDICSRLPDYSEKMIQRELVELIRTGQVIKSGSKRWSTYSLAV